MLDINLEPYSWIDNPSFSFSADLYRNLQETRHASMTKKECLEYIKKWYENNKDYLETAEEIDKRRELYYNKLIKDGETKKLATLQSNDAFPFEIMFQSEY